MTLILDATGMVLGRLASYTAKRLLSGENVIIVNAENTLISGKPNAILKDGIAKQHIKNKASLNVGPYHYKRPDRFVRRTIRGMLPWGKSRGRDAFKHVMVYIGEPAEEIKRNHDVDISSVEKTDLKDLKKNMDLYMTVGQLCKSIGGKW